MSELVVNETNPSIDSRRNYDTISTISVDEVFKKKMNFLGLVQQILGVIMVIFGGLYCLTIIGAILGVPFILIGLKIFKSGEAYKKSIITLEGGDIKEGECPKFCVNSINNIFELDENSHLIFKFCLQNKCSIESKFLPS